jgi:hypothetical protein
VNTPPFLLAGAMLFWGWQTGFWPVALACTVALEAAHWLPRRYPVEEARQMRIADLCLVLAAMVGTGCWVVYGNPRAIVLLFQWLPVILMPLALLQAWGADRHINLAVMFWSLRRMRARHRYDSVNLAYPVLLAWLVGASAANRRDAGFTIGIVIIGAWALWGVRNRRIHAGLWLAQLVVVMVAGTALHTGLNAAQLWLEGAAPEWMLGQGGTRTNPWRSSTDLGEIGELKQSDTIILRVATGVPLAAPPLLHRASYNEYGGTAWLVRGMRFADVAPDGAGGRWRLGAGAESGSLEVAEFAVHGNPVLALPPGAVSVAAAAASLRRNALGAVQAEAAPGYLVYRVGTGGGGIAAAPPEAADTRMPGRERAVIEATATELGLTGLAPEAALARVRAHLRERFRYATRVGAPAAGRTPLAEFLLGSRAGHCEFFASATVLLLRAAGVPARYATGFSLQEYDARARAYVVRERHAHAWVRAWVGGAWVDVDTTPPGWAESEDQARGAMARAATALADAWSGLRYRYARWQQDSSEVEKWSLFGAIGALVLAWLAWRVMGGGRRRDAGASGHAVVPPPVALMPGADSAFYGIEALLARRGLARGADESAPAWVARLARDPALAAAVADLPALAELHVRYRFDPRGLRAEERRRLDAGCARWLARQAETVPA